MGDVSSYNKLLSDKTSQQQKQKPRDWGIVSGVETPVVLSKVNVYSFILICLWIWLNSFGFIYDILLQGSLHNKQIFGAKTSGDWNKGPTVGLVNNCLVIAAIRQTKAQLMWH